MQQESNLQGMTLGSWTLEVWRDHRRGQPLTGHSAAMARSLQHHKEWWTDWTGLEMKMVPEHDLLNRLIHVQNDAVIMLQLDSGQPGEVKTLFEALTEKGFNEFESIHTLALAYMEEMAHAREHSETFDLVRYIERAGRFTKEALSRPNLARAAKAKAY